MSHPLFISEVTAKSLSAASRCFKEGSTSQAIEVMKDEVRLIAREVARWQLSGEAKARIFLRPLETVLVNHYGSHNGRRLYWDFVDAFWLQSWSETPLEISRVVETLDEPEIERRATG
jgi:hypothetical protein